MQLHFHEIFLLIRFLQLSREVRRMKAHQFYRCEKKIMVLKRDIKCRKINNTKQKEIIFESAFHFCCNYIFTKYFFNYRFLHNNYLEKSKENKNKILVKYREHILLLNKNNSRLCSNYFALILKKIYINISRTRCKIKQNETTKNGLNFPWIINDESSYSLIEMLKTTKIFLGQRGNHILRSIKCNFRNYLNTIPLWCVYCVSAIWYQISGQVLKRPFLNA